jgi:acetoin utilization deacetylase AcuC-like enzyme
MKLTMPVVWDDDCRLHDPAAEIWIGVRTPAVETAARTDAILEALRGAGADVVDASRHANEALLAVHDAALLEYLASAWAEWDAAVLPVERSRTARQSTPSSSAPQPPELPATGPPASAYRVAQWRCRPPPRSTANASAS